MYAACHQFFAHTIFAGDQHSGIGGGYFVYGVLYALHALAGPYHLIGSGYALAQLLGLYHQRLFIHRVADGNKQAVQVRRLGDVVVSAFFYSIYSSLYVAMAADHDEGRIGPLLMCHLQYLDAIHTWHLDVAEDTVVVVLFDLLYAFGAICRFINSKALEGEYLDQGFADRFFVVYDQYVLRHGVDVMKCVVINVVYSISASGGCRQTRHSCHIAASRPGSHTGCWPVAGTLPLYACARR